MFILSARANLSKDYFTNRRDRYVLFQDSPGLSAYLSSLHRIICQHSFLARSGGLEPPSLVPDPLASSKNAEIFTASFSEKMNAFVQEWTDSHSSPETEDTLVYPLVQMGEYSIRQDQLAMQDLLAGLGRSEHACIASGYFNIPPQYLNAILSSEGRYKVIAAAPEVGVN